jgi:ribosomal subunit interface protein
VLILDIISKDIAITGEIEEYIRERAAHFDRLFASITSGRVSIEAPSQLHHRQGGPFDVHVALDVPGTTIHVTKQTATELHVALRLAFAATERQLEDYVRKQRHEVKTHQGPLDARVARLFPDKGYGFLVDPDGREVYFHKNAVLQSGFERLSIGDHVQFSEEQGDQGPQATTVTPR